MECSRASDANGCLSRQVSYIAFVIMMIAAGCESRCASYGARVMSWGGKGGATYFNQPAIWEESGDSLQPPRNLWQIPLLKKSHEVHPPHPSILAEE